MRGIRGCHSTCPGLCRQTRAPPELFTITWSFLRAGGAMRAPADARFFLICVPIQPRVCPSICPGQCLSGQPSVHPPSPASSSACLSSPASVHPHPSISPHPTHPSIHLSISGVHPSARTSSIPVSICPCLHPSIHASSIPASIPPSQCPPVHATVHPAVHPPKPHPTRMPQGSGITAGTCSHPHHPLPGSTGWGGDTHRSPPGTGPVGIQ